MRRSGWTRSVMITMLSIALLFFVSGCGSTETQVWESGSTSEQTETSSAASSSMVEESDNTEANMKNSKINITVNGHTLTASLSDNSSADALRTMLANGPVTISMHDYESMEKVGNLGQSLPRNDENITTKAGDLILYLGNQFVIYYAPNSWNFTRLGKIDDISADELKSILGDGDVKAELSIDED
ncbi:MAG: cyclophilin-like fold protein [Chordicoccus sp.]